MNYHQKINRFIKDKKQVDSENHVSPITLPSWAKNFMISAGIATSLIACPNQDNNKTTPSDDTNNPPSRREQGREVQPEEPVTPVVPEEGNGENRKKDPRLEPRKPPVRPLYGVPTP
ncbi:MAG: hypothetical protein PF689_06660 [Deltaproteobacteria bacterium]|nr:hypothetical protein [Deltaproteobacteria bacterium]